MGEGTQVSLDKTAALKIDSALIWHAALTASDPRTTAPACRPSLCPPRSAAATDLEGGFQEETR